MRRIKDKIDVLKSDRDLVTFYFTHDKCILLDAKVNEVMNSDDVDRMNNMLVLLKSFDNDKMFKSVSEKIERLLNIKGIKTK
jgi:hypothetical protein